MFYYNIVLLVRAEIGFCILQNPRSRSHMFFLCKACVRCVFYYNHFHFKMNNEQIIHLLSYAEKHIKHPKIFHFMSFTEKNIVKS